MSPTIPMIEAVELSATYEGLLKCGLITFYGKSPISFLRGATQPLVGDPPRKPSLLVVGRTTDAAGTVQFRCGFV